MCSVAHKGVGRTGNGAAAFALTKGTVMTAPALILLAHGTPEPQVSTVTHALRKQLQALRPELVVRAAFIDNASPSVPQVLAQLSRKGMDEAVLVPMAIASAIEHGPEVDELLARCRASHPSLHLAVSRPLGPATDLLCLLDQRLRTALRHAKALELDGLVLSAPSAGDVRGNALIARRVRQWSTHHRLPCSYAVADGSGPSVAQAITTLRGQGRRHIGVGSFFLTPTDAFLAQRELALRCGAVAVSEPFGADERVLDLVLARYAYAAMDLLDAVEQADLDDVETAPAVPALSVVG